MGEWVTDYDGGRKLVLSGTLVNALGEPLQYECNSRIVVHVKGKTVTFDDESELHATGCSDPGPLGIGKRRSFSSWVYNHPAISRQMLEYPIDRVDWTFEASAATPFGTSFTWVVARRALPLPSEKMKFPMLEAGSAGAETPGAGSKAPRKSKRSIGATCELDSDCASGNCAFGIDNDTDKGTCELAAERAE